MAKKNKRSKTITNNEITTAMNKKTKVVTKTAAPAAPIGEPLTHLTEPQPMLYRTLHRALSVKRPHGGQGVAEFTMWLYKQLPEGVTTHVDKCGNIHVDNRRDARHRTLFTAHVDTVHSKDGLNRIRTDGKFWYADGDVLGADDGVGCALLMHMLVANVPAYFIFTQGEERGGIGAKFVADHFNELLREFDRAIAFDRRGIDSVITHQGWGRCCSDTFGEALAEQLNRTDMEMFYLNDDTGIYTDTAEFVHVIPECTNLSCGYYSEHTQAERLDLTHFNRLANACITIDWDALPTKRDPKVVEEKSWGFGSTYTTYKTSTSVTTNLNDYWDDMTNDWDVSTEMDKRYYKARAIDALLDATQGYTIDLEDMIAEAVYPDDPRLARKHMRIANLDNDTLEYAINCVEDGYDIDTVMLDLFDIAHTH